MTAFASPVQWLPDGIPHNPRFNDRYRGDGDDGLSGILQARHVFLGGCDLPGAWSDAPSWTLLETGFGLGLNFLATWQAWRADPLAPRLLHYVAIEAWPPTADDLQRGAAPYPELAPLAQELAERWVGLLPGFHRLAFDEGRVQLTLCIGEVRAMLRELRFEADSVYLDGFTPALNPDMWDMHTLKAVSHLCRRGTRVATWTIARSVRDGLAQHGFIVEKAAGLPPKRDCLRATWDPPWTPRRPEPAPVAPWAGVRPARPRHRCRPGGRVGGVQPGTARLAGHRAGPRRRPGCGRIRPAGRRGGAPCLARRPAALAAQPQRRDGHAGPRRRFVARGRGLGRQRCAGAAPERQPRTAC
jgi:tRNA U34 5-methylaminomethyl-2-thiouridine-forming methyltransferase MnmC